MSSLRACHCCGQIHHLRPMSPHESAYCRRCGGRIAADQTDRASQRCAAAAIVALILFFPAIFLPILEIEKLGHRHSSSILAGTLELLREGAWFVGTIVLVFSIVFPLAKMVLLLELSLMNLLHRRHKAITFRWMETLGKWSMMDVMLLAFLVMLIKLGHLVEFKFGPAAIAFTLCVASSMVASMLFDPHAIWDHGETNDDAE
jgi:paraquat-inducible protein A